MNHVLVKTNPHHVSLLVPALRNAASLLGDELDILVNYDSTAFILLNTAPQTVRQLMFAYLIQEELDYEYV